MNVHACTLLSLALLTHANTLVNPASGKCLDISGGDCSDTATVELFHCQGANNQEWHIEDGALKNSKCGKCLDIQNFDYKDGATVQLFTCNGGDNQKWNFQDGAVVNPASGKCLDIFASCMWDDLCKVELFTCNGGDNQKWNNPSGSNMANQTDSLAMTSKPTASSSSTTSSPPTARSESREYSTPSTEVAVSKAHAQDCSYYCHLTQEACDYCRGVHGISSPCYVQKDSYCQHCGSRNQNSTSIDVVGDCKYKCHLNQNACETCGLPSGCHCDYQANSWCEHADLVGNDVAAIMV